MVYYGYGKRWEKEKKDYELKVLPKREGSLRVRIRIRTKDYKKNIERIIRETNKKYRNIYPREK